MQVIVGLPQPLEAVLRARGDEVPPPRPVVAVIDTGSSASTVSSAIVRDLQLQPVSRLVVNVAGGRTECTRYRVRYVFPGGNGYDLYALRIDLGHPRIECLLGRDLLGHTDLEYQGGYNRWRLFLR